MEPKRPDGSGQNIAAWCMTAIAVLAFILAFAINNGGHISQSDIVFGWLVTAVAFASTGLAVLLFSVGAILRALWFLPARDFPETEPGDDVTATGAILGTVIIIAFGLIVGMMLRGGS